MWAVVWLILGIITLWIIVTTKWIERQRPFCDMPDGLACFVALMLWPYVWWLVWRRR